MGVRIFAVAAVLSVVLSGCAANSVEISTNAGTLLGGGRTAFSERIASERGRGIVVNQWASWCQPCKLEFPHFIRQSKKRERAVTFLGVNTSDNRESAERFLAKMRPAFDNYFDPDAAIARTFKGGRAMPTTGFYDPSGKLRFVHLGAYGSEAQLASDIEKHTR